MLEQLLRKTRSYRRFFEDEILDIEVLIELISLTRFCPSAGNLQPLKYILSTSKEQNSIIFNTLSWAAYLKDWAGPQEGERPSGYIIILGDKKIAKDFKYDAGICAQTIMLGATERGLGGCILASINRQTLREKLDIAEHLEILLVLALGKPKETIVLEDISSSGDIRYWRDEKDIHHVPKRLLDELIIKKFA